MSSPVQAQAAETSSGTPQVVLPAPEFVSVQRPLPERGLLLSCLLHVSLLAILPMLAPPARLVIRPIQVAASFDPITYYPDPQPLPSLGDRGAKSGSSPSAGSNASAKNSAAAQAAAASLRSMAQYAGPQEIISDPPDATNTIQTIRRPDLIKPMKIKNPVRLRSTVQIPAPPVVKMKAAPPEWLAHPIVTPATPVAAQVTSNAPPVKEAALVVRRSERPPQLKEVAPPSVMPSAKDTAPILSAPAGNAPTLAKAVVVINAVEVPPDPGVAIPDGEISGRFAVAPLQASVRPPDPNGSSAGDRAGRNGAGTNGTGTASGTNPNGDASGSGTLLASGGAGGGHAGNGAGASGPGTGTAGHTGTGNGSGTASGTGTGSGSGPGAGVRGGNGATGSGGVGNGRGAGMGGISIAGGSSGRGGSVHSAAAAPRSYGLTIISAGNSGGTSHDLGVFERSETVYSVYLSMNDAGGGSAWPMQYALADTPNSTGMLTPPFPTKKVKAVRTVNDTGTDSSPVYIVGVIDADGNVQALHAARASDQRSKAAIAVLAQWQFTPAKLDGKAVPAKVLIGVMMLANPVAVIGTQ
jgi:hypothetical protein